MVTRMSLFYRIGGLAILCGSLLDHGETIAAVVIDDLVHDVVDKQHAAAARFEEILGVKRIGNVVDVETFALVLDGKACLRGRYICGDPDQLLRVESIPMLDRVHKRLV